MLEKKQPHWYKLNLLFAVLSLESTRVRWTFYGKISLLVFGTESVMLSELRTKDLSLVSVVLLAGNQEHLSEPAGTSAGYAESVSVRVIVARYHSTAHTG